MKLFISPHNDDETLFGAFTILREQPLVLIVTNSVRQAPKGIRAAERMNETFQALAILRSQPFFLGLADATLNRAELDERMKKFIANIGPFEHIYTPAHEERGHPDHNLIAGLEFNVPTTRYLTYTAHGKSRSQNMVPFETDWPLLKLQALSCYRSQIFEPSTRDHFLRDQYEYYAA